MIRGLCECWKLSQLGPGLKRIFRHEKAGKMHVAAPAGINLVSFSAQICIHNWSCVPPPPVLPPLPGYATADVCSQGERRKHHFLSLLWPASASTVCWKCWLCVFCLTCLMSVLMVMSRWQQWRSFIPATAVCAGRQMSGIQLWLIRLLYLCV